MEIVLRTFRDHKMNIKNIFIDNCQKLAAMFSAPSRKHGQVGLLLLGLGLLVGGLSLDVLAQSEAEYNHERLDTAIEVIFQYIEGSFGALVMIASGIGAILSSAFGQYRAALGLLVVAVGAYILRSITDAFFDVDVL
jgi:uncharacterized membrane protein